MKAECQDCGKKLKNLYWTKFIELVDPLEKSQMISLEDFYYCPWCNMVYRREIKTEVMWYKLDRGDAKE